MKDIKKIIASNIKRLRTMKGWTQSHLAETANISLRGLQDLEYEKNDAKASTLFLIAKALDADMTGLCDPDGPTKKKRSEMIGDIVATLAALNDEQLDDVAVYIDRLTRLRKILQKDKSK